MFNGKKIKALEQRVADLEATNTEQSKRIDGLLELIEMIDNRLLIRDAQHHITELDQLVMGRLLKVVAVRDKMTLAQLKAEFLRISADVERAEAERIAKSN